MEDYIVIEDHFYCYSAFKKLIKEEKRLPFFDFIIITIMEDLKIREIATFDKHFKNLDSIKRIY